MADLKDKIIGGFKVLEAIQAGAGAQGTVYRAECVEDVHGLAPVGTMVALKVMAVQDEGQDLWRRLVKRTEGLARLDHPNVVKYFGCFSEQGDFTDLHVVVQEFLNGETLKDRLARNPSGLDADEAVKMVDAALAGLSYTASRGMVHRDVKPGNIFVCLNAEGGVEAVKLIDFELAKQAGGTTTTSTGNIRGSFDYMAPDFTDPEFHGDVQSDVFSMGVVLHEVLTGKTPYQRIEADDKQANFVWISRWAHALSDGDSPIRISGRVKRLLAHADEVLSRALAPRREQRYRDFDEFRAGLKTMLYRELASGENTYRLLQFIGKGGFGEVFKARHVQTGRPVAVKHLLKADYADRFHREAKIMKKLDDPCFVRFIDFFVLEGGGGRDAFLVMDFLPGMPGSSLRDAVKAAKGRGLPPRDVLAAFERYARGLAVMHAQGIYHRDIKPSNLYYPQGHPEWSAIMDFGIARDEKGSVTSGMVPGTLDYMPPEVVLTDSRGDSASDIYALGLCLYEALSGKLGYPRLPAGSAAYAEFFNRARSKKPPAFDDEGVAADRELLALLREMTAPDASRRMRDTAALVSRLRAMRMSRGDEEEVEAATRAEPETSPTNPFLEENLEALKLEGERIRARRRGRKTALWTLLALLAAAGAGAAGYYGWQYRERRMREFEAMKSGVSSAKPAAAPRPEAPLPKAETAAVPAKPEPGAESDEDRRTREAEIARRAREEAERIAEERHKADLLARLAEERRKAEEEAAKKAEEQRKADEAAEKARLEEYNRRVAEAEEKIRKAEEMRKAEEEAARKAEELRKAREEAARKAEEQRKALEEAARKAEEERKAEEARRKAEEEAARKAEELRKAREEAARKAEEQRKALEEAARKAEEERRAEEARRKAEEEAEKKAAAERRRRLEEERKALAAKEAEAARLKVDANAKAGKAREMYGFEEYHDTLRYFSEAKAAGYNLTAEDAAMVEKAYKVQKKRLDTLIDRSYKMMQQGRALIRPLKDIEDERRQLMEWNRDLKGR